MKKNILILCISTILFLNGSAHADFPLHLGGFTIGGDVTAYSHMIDMETVRGISFNEYLVEGQIIKQPGFKSGLITYGVCDKPNKILRIKLKFSDSSKRFFNLLLKKYEKQFGPPDEYKGDPFQTIIAWKWSFTNKDNERLSLILQHNLMVEDEKIGTAAKLTLTSQIEKERACYKIKFPEKSNSKEPIPGTKKDLWKLFVPY